jgi:hypothetical protein
VELQLLKKLQPAACFYRQERGMIELPTPSLPPTNSSQFMNSPLLPEIDSPQPRHPSPMKLSTNWLPTSTSWIRALCLLPLAMPGIRVVVSGLAWFTWLNFPFSWLVATTMFTIMHLVIPVLMLAGLYHLSRSLWPNTPKSIYRNIWFAVSTMAIILLSFTGTVGVAALAEVSVCRVPQLSILVGGCSNHFVQTGWQDLVNSIDTYNFRYYTWMLWLIMAAYLYQIEAILREQVLPRLITRKKYPAATAIIEMNIPTHSENSSINQEFFDETA